MDRFFIEGVVRSHVRSAAFVNNLRSMRSPRSLEDLGEYVDKIQSNLEEIITDSLTNSLYEILNSEEFILEMAKNTVSELSLSFKALPKD
jgi:hypothetical protein